VEVVRFGVGNRRPEGPPGTIGITGQVIHLDGRGVISELAFARNARIEPHSNPNTTWFVVIEGGGWVAVGEDRSRVHAGEAVLWPASIPHAAWTDLTEMRAIVVEYAGADDAGSRAAIDGVARPAVGAPGASAAPVVRVEGGVAGRERSASATTREGEPY
jgi:quercetin dioxygenase-like cupin family protein